MYIKKISNKHNLYIFYSDYTYIIYNSFYGVIAKTNKINFDNDVIKINVAINDNFNTSSIKNIISYSILEYEQLCTSKQNIIVFDALKVNDNLCNKYYLDVKLKEY